MIPPRSPHLRSASLPPRGRSQSLGAALRTDRCPSSTSLAISRRAPADSDRAVALQSCDRRRPARGCAARVTRGKRRRRSRHGDDRSRRARNAPRPAATRADGDYDALVALGAVVRGETYHFEIVCNESRRDCPASRSSSAYLLARDPDLRHRRASRSAHGQKGYEAAQAAIEMANLLEAIDEHD
jgi:hypothetical protein